MGRVARCLSCQGNGKILREVKPGVWKEQTCFPCGGTGKVNTGLV